MKKRKNIMTNELEQTTFNWIKDNPNNFSKWYEPLIKGCGDELKLPKTYYFTTPDEVLEAMFKEDGSEYKLTKKWIVEKVLPNLPEDMIGRNVFIKNATFSGKYKAECFAWCTAKNLAEAFMRINNHAAVCDAEGYNELIIRERIHINSSLHPCIYKGLPFVPEFRVFYDFDTHKALYCVNYWDYDYCRPALYNKTDQIVFDHEKEYMKNYFEKHKKIVMNKTTMFLKNVKMSGIWSVDIMVNPESEEYWMIDMARGPESVYWDEEKL